MYECLTVKDILELWVKGYKFDMIRRGFTFKEEDKNPQETIDELRSLYPEFKG